MPCRAPRPGWRQQPHAATWEQSCMCDGLIRLVQWPGNPRATEQIHNCAEKKSFMIRQDGCCWLASGWCHSCWLMLQMHQQQMNNSFVCFGYAWFKWQGTALIRSQAPSFLVGSQATTTVQAKFTQKLCEENICSPPSAPHLPNQGCCCCNGRVSWDRWTPQWHQW